MIAAIYARKSTDQAGVADEQKSISRQVEHARAYATGKGWTVADEYVYVDDGISGAEFANRPGFLRLMNAVKPRPPFQVLVISDLDRLGRESIETPYAIKQLNVAGVRVFAYLEDKELRLDSPIAALMTQVQAFGAALERDKARVRVTDAMLRKARAGHVTGGRVFGYDNVRLGPKHVERRINETEAAVVRRIFALSAAGTGYTRIAKLLNAERVPSPRPQQGRPAGWAPTTIKEVLNRRLYLGEVTYNRTRKRNAWGQKRATARPPADWLVQTMPALQIVSADAWTDAHGRLAGIKAQLVKAAGGDLRSRHTRDIESKYLLSGFARCAVCGGALTVVSRSHGKQRAHFYACLAYHKRGTAICGNSLQLPIATIDHAVLTALAGDVLRPAVIMAIVDGVLAEMQPQAVAREVERFKADLRDAERAIGNLTKAIAVGGQLEPLLVELHAQQAKRADLVRMIGARDGAQRQRFDRNAIERTVQQHCDQWHELLTRHVADSRQLLREVLAGPLRFTPEGRAYRFEGEVALGRLIAGMAGVATFGLSPTGIEPSGIPWLREFLAA